ADATGFGGALCVLGKEFESGLERGAHDRQLLSLALELGRRVAVDVRRRAHLVRVPQRPGDVHALQPRHPVEVLPDHHQHVLRPALTLRTGTAQVRDARAAEHRAIEWPPVRDPTDVALELAVVELLRGHPTSIVAGKRVCGKTRTPFPNNPAVPGRGITAG